MQGVFVSDGQGLEMDVVSAELRPLYEVLNLMELDDGALLNLFNGLKVNSG